MTATVAELAQKLDELDRAAKAIPLRKELWGDAFPEIWRDVARISQVVGALKIWNERTGERPVKGQIFQDVSRIEQTVRALKPPPENAPTRARDRLRGAREQLESIATLADFAVPPLSELEIPSEVRTVTAGDLARLEQARLRDRARLERLDELARENANLKASIEAFQRQLNALGGLEAAERLAALSRSVDDAALAAQSLKAGVPAIGAEHHRQHYAALAEDFNAEAEKWLRYTGWAAALLVVAVVAVLLQTSYGDPPEDAVGAYLARAVLVVTAVGIVLWCSRNYRANRHNAIANLDRQASQQSFQSYLVGATEPAVRDAILRSALPAIFAPRSTGFGREDRPTIEHPLAEAAAEVLRREGGK